MPRGPCTCSKSIISRGILDVLDRDVQKAADTECRHKSFQICLNTEKAEHRPTINAFKSICCIFGFTTGLKEDLISTRKDQGKSGPSNVAGFMAMCSAKSLHGRAFFGPDGAISTTIRRLYRHIEGLNDIISRLRALVQPAGDLQNAGPPANPPEENSDESEGSDASDEAAPRMRYPAESVTPRFRPRIGPTHEAERNGTLSRRGMEKRRRKCWEARIQLFPVFKEWHGARTFRRHCERRQPTREEASNARINIARLLWGAREHKATAKEGQQRIQQEAARNAGGQRTLSGGSHRVGSIGGHRGCIFSRAQVPPCCGAGSRVARSVWCSHQGGTRSCRSCHFRGVQGGFGAAWLARRCWHMSGEIGGAHGPNAVDNATGASTFQAQRWEAGCGEAGSHF